MNDVIKYSLTFQYKNQRVSNKDSKGQIQNKRKEFVQWVVAMATLCQWMFNILEVYMGWREGCRISRKRSQLRFISYTENPSWLRTFPNWKEPGFGKHTQAASYMLALVLLFSRHPTSTAAKYR